MKKFFALLLAIIMLLTMLVGCNDSDIDQNGDSNKNESQGNDPSGNETTNGKENNGDDTNGGDDNNDELVIPTEPSEGLLFRLAEDGLAYYVSGVGTCTDEVVVIPDTYNGKPVFAIDEYCFAGQANIKRVIIPNSVSSILQSAFSFCGIESVTIPSSVYYIEWAAFDECWSLKEINFEENSNLKVIEGDSFQSCGIRSITIPASVTVVEKFAFDNCILLQEVDFEENSCLETIEEDAFDGCHSLSKITFPKSVKNIEPQESLYSLREISVEEGNTIYHSSGNCIIETLTKTLVLGSRNSVIPDDGSVTKIGRGAFAYALSLTIPSSITEIEGLVNVFEIYNLSSLDLSNYAENVYTQTSGASRLINQNGFVFYHAPVPKKVDGYNFEYFLVDHIGNEGDITLPKSVNGQKYCLGADGTLDSAALIWVGNHNITSATVPNTITSCGALFVYCGNLKKVTFEEGMNIVSFESAFMGCASLVEVEFPSNFNVEDGFIDEAFTYCVSLDNIELPNTIQEICYDSFLNCVSLTNINIPVSVKTVEGFVGCISLKEVKFHNGVEYISGFDYCFSLESMSIPFSVKEIGGFNDCISLKEVKFHNGVEYIRGFDDCFSLESMSIPFSVKEIGGFNDCIKLSSVTFSSGSLLNKIEHGSFQGCISLTEFDIPQYVSYIGAAVFGESCHSLKKINFKNTSGSWSVYKLSDHNDEVGEMVANISGTELQDSEKMAEFFTTIFTLGEDNHGYMWKKN